MLVSAGSGGLTGPAAQGTVGWPCSYASLRAAVPERVRCVRHGQLGQGERGKQQAKVAQRDVPEKDVAARGCADDHEVEDDPAQPARDHVRGEARQPQRRRSLR